MDASYFRGGRTAALKPAGPRFVLLLALIVTLSARGLAQNFTITLEAPKIQQSALQTNPAAFGATGVFVETFNSFPTGFKTTTSPFAGSTSLGSYDQVFIVKADAFGGAGGTGNYLTVNTNFNRLNSSTVLTLATPQRYFGLWWSAGDPNNVLDFYRGTTLLATFKTSDVLNLINSLPNRAAYFGNPNNGKNTGEPYAFLNFFANASNPNVTYDRVVFTNSGSSGFEQDNNTIAASYASQSGTIVPQTPQPSIPIDLGTASGTTGMLTIAGAETIAPSTTVGDKGNDVLLVDNTGSLTTGDNVIGNQPGSNGQQIISGNDAVVNSGDTTVGNGGTGALNIMNGGTLNTDSVNVANDPGSTGSLKVDGTDSKIENGGSLTIGDNGSGTATVTNGGVVDTESVTIASQPGSTGTAVVDGPGSQLNATGMLEDGVGGTGLLQVTNDAIVTANEGTIIGPFGVLTGDSQIVTPSLINNGIVAPQSSTGAPATLTINGNYLQGSTGILKILLDGPSNFSVLSVTGTAQLNGTLSLASSNNFTPGVGQCYTVLTANGGVNGQFSQVVDSTNAANLNRVQIYSPNGVTIAYLRSTGTPQVLNLFTTSNLPTFTMSNGQQCPNFTNLFDPNLEQYTSLFQVGFTGANTQHFTIADRFDAIRDGSRGFVSNVTYNAAPTSGKEVVEGKGVVSGKEPVEPSAPALQNTPENRWGVWVTGFGDFASVDDDSFARGYNFTNGGVTVGFDYRLTDNLIIGSFGSYYHTWVDQRPSGSSDVDTGLGGIYLGYFRGGFYVDVGAYGGGYSFDSSRQGLLGFADGSSDGYEWSIFGDTGYDFHFGRLTFGPIASIQYTEVHVNGFTETGSAAPARIFGDSEDSFVTNFGLRASYTIPAGRLTFRPFGRAAWQHEYKYSALPITATLADFDEPPTTTFGPHLGHDSAVLDAGVSVQISDRLSAYVSYNGQLGRDRYNNNGVSGGFRLAF